MIDPLLEYAASSGEKFPLLVARLACMRMSRSVYGDDCVSVDDRDMENLCFANMSHIPDSWKESHQALLRCFPNKERIENLISVEWYTDMMSRVHPNAFRVDRAYKVPLVVFHIHIIYFQLFFRLTQSLECICLLRNQIFGHLPELRKSTRLNCVETLLRLTGISLSTYIGAFISFQRLSLLKVRRTIVYLTPFLVLLFESHAVMLFSPFKNFRSCL